MPTTTKQCIAELEEQLRQVSIDLQELERNRTVMLHQLRELRQMGKAA